MATPLYKTLLVIDDHKMISNGIKLIAGPLFESFYTAHDAATGLSKALEYAPSLIIIDYYLPDMPGDALARELKYKMPASRILAYSFSYTPDVVIKMVKAGVNGYVVKTEDDEELIKAIRLLMEGRDFFCKEARSHIINRFTTSTDDLGIKHLIANIKFSGTEIELIRLLCRQMSTKEISKSLFLSERTIEQYRSNLMRKIKAKSIAGVIKFAIRNGIVLLDEL